MYWICAQVFESEEIGQSPALRDNIVFGVAKHLKIGERSLSLAVPSENFVQRFLMRWDGTICGITSIGGDTLRWCGIQLTHRGSLPIEAGSCLDCG